MKMPHFKVRTNVHFNKHSVSIELAGEIIHKVDDLYEFQKALGFTVEMARAGILHDEYVWERFVKDSEARCSLCVAAGANMLKFSRYEIADGFAIAQGVTCDAGRASEAALHIST